MNVTKYCAPACDFTSAWHTSVCTSSREFFLLIGSLGQNASLFCFSAKQSGHLSKCIFFNYGRSSFSAHLHALLTHVVQDLMLELTNCAGYHIYLVPVQTCMHHVHSTLLSGIGHNKIFLAEFPDAVSKGNTITFIIEPFGWYQIQSNVRSMAYIL